MPKTKLSHTLIAGIIISLIVLFSFVFFRDQFNKENSQINDSIKNSTSPTPALITPTISLTPVPTPISKNLLNSTLTLTPPQNIKYNVPFTTQAPFANWDDPFQQDGCEEASALMAVYWAKGEMIASPEVARDIILDAAEWQLQNYPTGRDTSAKDTTDRIIKQYFDWPKARVETLTNLEQIILTLQNGSLVITPMNGQKLGNPYYSGEGPERHMLVIIGYSTKTEEFITNDPGTRQGKDFRYQQDIFWEAIRDYPTGNHEPITTQDKMMIVVSK